MPPPASDPASPAPPASAPAPPPAPPSASAPASPPAPPSAPKPGIVALRWSFLFGMSFTRQDIVAPWVMVVEDLTGLSSYLKLRASGRWSALAGLPDCTPDGLAGQSFPDDRLILPDCPVGALIGRIGGSSAAVKAAAAATDAGESKPFPIGSFTLLKLPDRAVGPLFLGFNILLRPIRLQALEIEISGGVSY